MGRARQDLSHPASAGGVASRFRRAVEQGAKVLGREKYDLSRLPLVCWLAASVGGGFRFHARYYGRLAIQASFFMEFRKRFFRKRRRELRRSVHDSQRIDWFGGFTIPTKYI